MENIIEVKDLSFEYEPSLKTIDHISFNIKKGEYVAILGHNGSGKSTIAKLLIGLLEKKSGTITVNGFELNMKNLYKVREQIGIVFQNPDNQFIGATVRDDIAFGLENLCVPRDKMDELIETYAQKVRMEKFLEHEPTKLSGGQKQRVAIAGILAMSPSIIILDEATSMLDPRGKSEINELVFVTLEVSKLEKSNDVKLVNNENILLQSSLAYIGILSFSGDTYALFPSIYRYEIYGLLLVDTIFAFDILSFGILVLVKYKADALGAVFT